MSEGLLWRKPEEPEGTKNMELCEFKSGYETKHSLK